MSSPFQTPGPDKESGNSLMKDPLRDVRFVLPLEPVVSMDCSLEVDGDFGRVEGWGKLEKWMGFSIVSKDCRACMMSF